MSVSIKLARTGSKNNPYYRIIAAPTRSKLDGKNLGIIGSYDPKLSAKGGPASGGKKLILNKALFDEWIKKGAIITKGVRKIIK